MCRCTTTILTRIGHTVTKGSTYVAGTFTAVLTKKRVLVRSIPNIKGAALTVTFSHIVKLLSRHMRFAPSILPTSVMKFGVCRGRAKRFICRPKAVVYGLFLTSRVGQASPGARSTLLRIVRRNGMAISNIDQGIPRPFIIVTARGPGNDTKARLLPRSRLSQFVAYVDVKCPSLRDRVRVTRKGAVAGTRSLRPILLPRRL